MRRQRSQFEAVGRAQFEVAVFDADRYVSVIPKEHVKWSYLLDGVGITDPLVGLRHDMNADQRYAGRVLHEAAHLGRWRRRLEV
jgi:hypothetical protein